MATKRKAAVKKPATKKKIQKPTPWNNSEAIYSLIGWLTARPNTLLVGYEHDNSAIAQLVGAFVKENNLPATRKSWAKPKAMTGLDHITNVPQMNAKSMDKVANDPESARHALIDAVLGMSPRDQDAAIAGFLQQIAKMRANRVDNMQRTIEDITKDLNEAMDNLSTFNAVLRGDFAVVKIPARG